MSDILSAGRLEDHPFAELSGLIFQENRTGELNLESGDRRRTVWFLGGNPVAVVSDDPQDHLARILLEHGKIGDDDARRLAELPETREALGGVDYLNKETLNWGVKSRFVNLCYDLFRWDEGDYSFREGDPPRDLFLLKVPAHSLLFKGVGLLGQTAVVDAVPDDAVCGAGTVMPSEARYLTADAHQLLEQCQPGRTVAEVLGGGSADADQSRRLLYALTCLGLITISRGGTAPAAVPGFDDEPGFILDDGEADLAEPAPAPEAPEPDHESAGIALDGEDTGPGFSLDLPPLGREDGSQHESLPDFDVSGTDQPGGYPFEAESGPEPFGSFGSFDADAPLGQPGESSSEDESGDVAPKKGSKASGGRFHVPRIVGIALGSLAAAGIIGFAGWWWMSGSEPPPPPVKPPMVRPAPPANAPVAAPAPAPAPAPATQDVASAPASAPEPAQAPAPPPAPATVPAPSTPPPAAPATAAGGADRYRSGLEVFQADDLDGAAAIWEAILTEEHRSDFTIQILTACQQETIREAQRSVSTQELYLVTKLVNGRVCFRVCAGVYASSEAAARALAGLPAAYRSAGAAVRPVAEILKRDR